MDKGSQRALRAVNQPPKEKPFSLAALLALVVISAFLLFAGGMFLGAPLRQWWREASIRQEQALKAPGEEARLREEAAIYTLFWERRWDRLEKAATRFGWTRAEFKKALRLIEAAKPRFQAVETGHMAWGQPGITYELLKKEVDELYEQLALTFCEEFKLVCERGVPPDNAHLKSGAKPKPSVRPSGKQAQGVFVIGPRVYTKFERPRSMILADGTGVRG